MEHLTDDRIAGIALGEHPADAAVHLRDCPRCAERLRSLRRIVATLKEPGPAAVELLHPPPGVWDAIAAELDRERPARPARRGAAGLTPVRRTAPLPALTAAPGVRPAATGSPRAAVDGGAGDRGTRRGRSGRPTRPAVALAECAALLRAAAGSGITWWAVTQAGSSGARDGGGAALDPLIPRAQGQARLAGTDDRRTLRVSVQGLPRTTGYFEVWLMDREHRKLIAMGVLGADGHAVLPVPQNLDLDEYSVVDVSVQPYDGSPDHSGESVVRGAYATGPGAGGP